MSQAASRVVSLDQCADQFMLALAPREAITGLSSRALARDSWMRSQAVGLPIRRATAESVLGARPDLVVRYWGGDERLQEALVRRGVRVVKIDDATDFDGVRANVRKVAVALDRRDAGEALVRRMDANLAQARGAWKGQSALYLTPSGYTAGSGTLVDAMLSAAGMRNAATRPGFAEAPLEKIVMRPPSSFVLGFFDMLSAAFERWGMGRHVALQKRLPGHTAASLPGAALGCPGWFAADAAAELAKARR